VVVTGALRTGGIIPDRAASSVGQAFVSAPFQPDGWDAALKALASHTGSARGQLIAIGGPRTVPLNWITDVASNLTDEFVAIDGGDPRRNWRVACTRGPFEIVGEDDYAEARAGDPRAFAAYDALMDRNGMMHGCQTVLSHDGGALLGLAVLRTEQDGVTTADERARFAEAAPFALAAVQMQRALEHEGAQLIAGALEAMKAAAFVCDGRGRVRALTATAEERLRRTRCVQLSGDVLSGRIPAEDRLLQQALKQAVEGGAPAAFWLRAEDGPIGSQRCEVYALPKQEWNLGFQPRALVVLCEPGSIGAAGRETVRTILELTSAEADVAVMVAEGVSRDQIAERRGTSADTVHAQMKSLYRKAEVKREAELVALLNRLMR
jgi:DNA-binding CsgD family transcriptional regulator